MMQTAAKSELNFSWFGNLSGYSSSWPSPAAYRPPEKPSSDEILQSL